MKQFLVSLILYPPKICCTVKEARTNQKKHTYIQKAHTLTGGVGMKHKIQIMGETRKFKAFTGAGTATRV